MKIKIIRAGGYDPSLGTDHPSNRDPSLEPGKSRETCDACGARRPRYLLRYDGEDGILRLVCRDENDCRDMIKHNAEHT